MKKKIDISKKLMTTGLALGLTASLNAGAVNLDNETILSAVELPEHIAMNHGNEHECGEHECGEHECGEGKCGH